MGMYFHFNVDPGYLGASTPNEIAVVTFAQMYENITEQLFKISDDDLASKGIVADSISQIIDILSDIKKWELDENFYNMRTEYLNIMIDHYNNLTKELSSD